MLAASRCHQPATVPVPGTCEVWSAVRRTPSVVALYAVVVALLFGGNAAAVLLTKGVALTVDGKTRPVRTSADSVGKVLEAAGVEVGPRDVVRPSAGAPVTEDTRIRVTHARKLRLTVNGATSTRWVTANTVGQALNELGMRPGNAALSAPRSHRLPLSAFSLTVRPPRTVTIKTGTAALQRTTTAPTVRKLLARAGIELGPHDRLNVDPSALPKSGQPIEVTQVLGPPKTKTVKTDFETVRRAEPEMSGGETEVVQKGHKGLKKVTVATVLRGGKKVQQVVSSVVKREPQKKIVEHGPQQPAEPSGGDFDSVESVDDLNWSALAECESGGNPNAVNPAGPYYGLYQFNMQTWRSVGGEGVPTDASASEQTYRAQLLYKRRGDAPWPVCGEHLYD